MRDRIVEADPDLGQALDAGMPFDENWASKEWKQSLRTVRRTASPPPPKAPTLPSAPEEPPF